jgi:hypothetical protein
MSDASKRIDAYIAKAPEFARPICKSLRKAILKAGPGIVEEWKWSCPVFSKGGLICAIGAFKPHVRFMFFKGALLKDPRRKLEPRTYPGMQSRVMLFKPGDRVDAKAVADFVRQAAALNANGATPPRPKRAELPAPRDLRAALSKDRKADSFFTSLTPSGRREYVEWIVEAKRPETRSHRISTTVLQCRQSKTRHWKYR